jgi:glycerol kinase
MSFILALDQGTTSSRAIVFNHAGQIVASAQKEFRQIFPQPGWVEHDAEEIWQTQLAVAKEAIAKAGGPIAAIGITNQRETVVIWDRKTGRPVHNAIVWQDRRTAGYCDSLKPKSAFIQERTGLVIDAYFSASKIRWLLDHVTAARGDVVFGTIDTWLLYKLTGELATDVSNASRTMLLNLQSGQWDPQLFELFGIPQAMAPTVKPSSGVFGETTLFGGRIPVAGIAGDQQAALFGQTCFDRGVAKNTYGTGCFLLMNVGQTPAVSKHELLSTIAWRRGGLTDYALEGSVFIGGAVVQWLRDGLSIIKTAADVEKLAASVPDAGGVYMVPAFAGLGAPHWDQYARGSVSGITRGTTAAHLARAALESIAFQVADIVDVMRQDSGIALAELRVDGGASANDLLMKIQADLLQVPVVRPNVTETTALGAAYLAGLAVGYWKDLADIRANWSVQRRFEPQMSADQVEHRRRRWAEALQRSKDWEEHSSVR